MGMELQYNGTDGKHPGKKLSSFLIKAGTANMD